MKKFIIILSCLICLTAFSYPKTGTVSAPTGALWGYDVDTNDWRPIQVADTGIVYTVTTALTTATPLYGLVVAPVGGIFGFDETVNKFRAIAVNAEGKIVVPDSGAITGITLSVDSGATAEVDTVKLIGGTDISLSRSGNEVTINSTASVSGGGISVVGSTAEPMLVHNGTTWEASSMLPDVMTVEGMSGTIITDNLKTSIEALDGEAVLAGASIELLETYQSTSGASIELLEIESGLAGASIELIEADYVKADSSPTFTGTVTASSFSGDGSTLTGILSGITISADSGTTYEVDTFDITAGDNITVDLTAGVFTINSTASGGISGITLSVDSGTTYEVSALNFQAGPGITMEYDSAGNLTVEALTFWDGSYTVTSSLSAETVFTVEVDTTDKIIYSYCFTADRQPIMMGISYETDNTKFWFTLAGTLTYEMYNNITSKGAKFFYRLEDF